MFNGRVRNRGFIEAKGPDFVSRLAKHLNIPGIDREREDDLSYMVRRAVILREKLEQYQPDIIRSGIAHVAEDVLKAFLHVRRFKHGVRSLEAIVRTTRVGHEKPNMHWGTLPQGGQLEMHVSVPEFQQAREV
jgi:hypothetical protein